MPSIHLHDFVKEMDLEVLYDAGLTALDVTSADLNRPGIQLAGYFAHFAAERIQVIGETEQSFMAGMSESTLHERLDAYFRYPLPAVVFSRSMTPPEELMAVARKYGRPVFRSYRVTTELVHNIHEYLYRELAESITIHGVLLDINGVGMLLTGESGIGKSETALEMIRRGHRLVADDVVDIHKVGRTALEGSAPRELRHFMEIRGLGIIDIRQLYGVGSVVNHKTINMVLEMEAWQEGLRYNRLGIDEDHTEILSIRLPKVRVPVGPGRNLAILMEAAAGNYRLKRMGYNSAVELERKLSQPEEKEK